MGGVDVWELGKYGSLSGVYQSSGDMWGGSRRGGSGGGGDTATTLGGILVNGTSLSIQDER